MEFFNELKRSKLEQHSCRTIYKNFKDKGMAYPTGPSGPGGGSWWWLESGNEVVISDGSVSACSKRCEQEGTN